MDAILDIIEHLVDLFMDVSIWKAKKQGDEKRMNLIYGVCIAAIFLMFFVFLVIYTIRKMP